MLWNWAYAYILTSTRVSKIFAGLDHNENPRHDLSKYGERAVAEGKLTRARLQQLQRAQAAHENCVEGFAFFASTSTLFSSLGILGYLANTDLAVVLMNMAKIDAASINLVGVLYSVLRVLYVQAYYRITDRNTSFVRSVLWHLTNYSCIYGIWQAGKFLQA